MGSGRDKKKKVKEKRGELQPGKGAQKTERKTLNNEDKKSRRADKALEGDEGKRAGLIWQLVAPWRGGGCMLLNPRQGTAAQAHNASWLGGPKRMQCTF